MGRFLSIVNEELPRRVGDRAAIWIIFGLPALVIGAMAWFVTGDLIQSAVVGAVGSWLLAYWMAAEIQAAGADK